MESSHLNWLQQHKEDPSFLGQALENGFSLHPLDGSRSNDSPDNLVLLYQKDARKLSSPEESFTETRLNKSRACYELRKEGQKWAEIASFAHVSLSNAWSLARGYAKARNLKWPL